MKARIEKRKSQEIFKFFGEMKEFLLWFVLVLFFQSVYSICQWLFSIFSIFLPFFSFCFLLLLSVSSKFCFLSFFFFLFFYWKFISGQCWFGHREGTEGENGRSNKQKMKEGGFFFTLSRPSQTGWKKETGNRDRECEGERERRPVMCFVCTLTEPKRTHIYEKRENERERRDINTKPSKQVFSHKSQR